MRHHVSFCMMLIGTLCCFGACSDDKKGEKAPTEETTPTTPQECAAGTLDCPCDNGTCQGDLICDNNLCKNPRSAGFTISDESVRSCEILLFDPVERLTKVSFADTVKGKFIKQGSKVAVTFFNKTDASFAENSVNLEYPSDGTAPADAFQILNSTCYDKNGAPVANVGITL